MTRSCIYHQRYENSVQIVCEKKGAVALQECDGCKLFNMRSRGVGDTVEKVLRSIGIPKMKNCNCGKRQQKLNEMFPYRPEG